jgi:hypothetical protein
MVRAFERAQGAVMIDVIIVPAKDPGVVLAWEDRIITVPPEWRKIKVEKDSTMPLASKRHTVGDTRKWTVDYERWLDNTVDIQTIDVQSSSTSCTIQSSEILGDTVVFFLTGGNLGETLTVSLTMTDTDGNIKNDQIYYTVVSP